MKASSFILAGAVALGLAAPAFAAGDAANGEKVFNLCKACHSLDAKTGARVGPVLAGVVGRKAASIEGFAYSDGVKKSGLTWTEENIDKWLTDTQAVVPGNKMTFKLPDAQKRADVIAFLKTK